MRGFSAITWVTGLMLGLTACSGADVADPEATAGSTQAVPRPTFSELFATALEEMAALETVRVAGWVDVDGRRIDSEMQLSKSGDCHGQVQQEDIGGFELIGVDGDY
ncbi:MAG: hypothetical protein H0X12_18035, partial [Nocardioides sp.]|nr:hypothetical protein [Nocardioides sp.]